MPTYEYECDKCGIFQIKRDITEDMLTACPVCNGDVEPIIASPIEPKKHEELQTDIYRRAHGVKADANNSSIVYEYECEECGLFKAKQGMSDDPLETCPKCQSKVERVISGGATVLPSPRPAYAFKRARNYKNVTSEGEKKRPINPNTDGYYGAQY